MKTFKIILAAAAFALAASTAALSDAIAASAHALPRQEGCAAPSAPSFRAAAGSTLSRRRSSS